MLFVLIEREIMRRIRSELLFSVVLLVLFSVGFAGAAEEVSFMSDSSGLKDGSYLDNVPKPSNKYKIANISRTLLNEHWVKNSDGFKEALDKYGLEGNVYAVQSENNVMKQLNLLETVVAKGYDAVAVSPISEKNLLPGLKKAAKNGIVIINIDTAEILPKDAEANNFTVATFIGSNNYDSGVIAADFMHKMLNGKNGKFAVIQGRLGDTCAIDRTAGFVDAINKYPNTTLVANQCGEWDRLKSLDVTTSILRANPDIAGIYCNNDTMVLGALAAAKDLGYEVLTGDNIEKRIGEPKTLVLIGNDGVPEAINAVGSGRLSGTIAQKPFLMGYSAVEAAIIALEGKEIPKKIHTPVKLITSKDF